MFSNDRNIEKIATLAEEIQQWSLLRKEQAKVEMADKASSLVSIIAIIVIVSMLILLLLICLSFAAAYAMASVTGSMTTAMLIVACVNAVLLLLVVMCRKRLIKQSLLKLAGFEGGTQEAKQQYMTQINRKEEDISKLWDNLFHEKEPARSGLFGSPTQRALDIVSSSTALIDGALLGWKLYRKFKKRKR